MPIPWSHAFATGVAGAFVVYFVMYRETRLVEVFNDPAGKWRVLVFDLILYLMCGGLVALFWGEPKTLKEAFTTGCAWQGIAGGAMAGVELKALKGRLNTAPRRKK
jgi:hypothetical protein